MPTDEEGGDLRQLTEGASRDLDVQYSPDGKSVAFVSDQSGREEIHIIAADGSGQARRLTDLDTLKSSIVWSPDSKVIAFTTSDRKLYTIGADGKNLKELASTTYGPIGAPAWSPDGKLIAYSKADVTRSTDVYLIPSTGGEEKKITFDSADESNPRFSADGTKVYFVRREGDMGAEAPPTSQIFCVPLEKLTRDPDEPEQRADGSTEGGPGGGRGAAARTVTAKTPTIDWAGLKRRTRQVTRAASVFNYIPANDGRTLIYVATEGGAGGAGGPGARGGAGGGGGTSSIYSIQDNGKRMTRIASATPRPATEAGDERPVGGAVVSVAGCPACDSPRTVAPCTSRKGSRSTPRASGVVAEAAVGQRWRPSEAEAEAARVAAVGLPRPTPRRPEVAVAGRSGGSHSTSRSGSKSPRNGTRCSMTRGVA